MRIRAYEDCRLFYRCRFKLECWPFRYSTVASNTYMRMIRSHFAHVLVSSEGRPLVWVFKYLASFLRNDWNWEDYPLRFRHQNGEDMGRLQLIPWTTQVERWPQMQGSGDSKQAALDDLRRHFQICKSEKLLPRARHWSPSRVGFDAMYWRVRRYRA